MVRVSHVDLSRNVPGKIPSDEQKFISDKWEQMKIVEKEIVQDQEDISRGGLASHRPSTLVGSPD
jgi:hypothetical protein